MCQDDELLWHAMGMAHPCEQILSTAFLVQVVQIAIKVNTPASLVSESKVLTVCDFPLTQFWHQLCRIKYYPTSKPTRPPRSCGTVVKAKIQS